jgi:hypothetical protein
LRDYFFGIESFYDSLREKSLDPQTDQNNPPGKQSPSSLARAASAATAYLGRFFVAHRSFRQKTS